MDPRESEFNLQEMLAFHVNFIQREILLFHTRDKISIFRNNNFTSDFVFIIDYCGSYYCFYYHNTTVSRENKNSWRKLDMREGEFNSQEG